MTIDNEIKIEIEIANNFYKSEKWQIWIRIEGKLSTLQIVYEKLVV